MMDVAVFALGGLTALVAWWLVLEAAFDGFMQGLLEVDQPVRCRRRSSDGESA